MMMNLFFLPEPNAHFLGEILLDDLCFELWRKFQASMCLPDEWNWNANDGFFIIVDDAYAETIVIRLKDFGFSLHPAQALLS